jgi:hypothetical protein
MQEQQQKQPRLRQKLQVAIQVAKVIVIYGATRQNSIALQIEYILVKRLEQLNVTEKQHFKLWKDT